MHIDEIIWEYMGWQAHRCDSCLGAIIPSHSLSGGQGMRGCGPLRAAAPGPDPRPQARRGAIDGTQARAAAMCLPVAL
jgi:hypothetical protein